MLARATARPRNLMRGACVPVADRAIVDVACGPCTVPLPRTKSRAPITTSEFLAVRARADRLSGGHKAWHPNPNHPLLLLTRPNSSPDATGVSRTGLCRRRRCRLAPSPSFRDRQGDLATRRVTWSVIVADYGRESQGGWLNFSPEWGSDPNPRFLVARTCHRPKSRNVSLRRLAEPRAP